VNTRPSPYVGPRSFATGEPLYGRDRERAALLDLVIAERIVLLHSPSGAGKSSLLQAGLIPDLRAEGFTVRPVLRVGIEPPARPPAGSNRFVLSTLFSLEEQATARPLAEVAALTLVDVLGAEPDDTEVLIFDQFEEILTVDPNDRAAKHAMFAALGQALRSPRRYAVFAMREDHVASLAPYVRPIPTRLRNTFRLDLLGPEAAMQAAQAPARAAGVDFLDAAARRLVDDLRQVRVQDAAGRASVELGAYVEPVQLQVTCRNLWDRLPSDDPRIEPEDVEAVGDVDQALADYYEAQVAAVAAAGASEREVRQWIERALITEHGLRSQVLQGAESSQGLANSVIRRLIDAHLIRAEKRRGMTWFELAHDRLIAPVRAANARWAAAHLSPAQRQAELWDGRGRPEALLLTDLAEVERMLAQPDVGAIERTFLEASARQCRREAETARLRRQSAILRVVIEVGLIGGLLALVVIYVTRSRADAEAATHARLLQLKAQATARVALAAARSAQARQLAAALLQLPERSLDLAALFAAAGVDLSVGWSRHVGVQALLSRTPQVVAVVPGTQSPIQVALDRAGQRLAGLDEHGALYLWALAPARRLAVHHGRGRVDVAHDGAHRRFVTVDLGGRVEFFEADGGAGRTLQLAVDDARYTTRTIAVSPAGDRLATTDERGEVSVWDAASGARLAASHFERVSVGPGARPLAFAPDGRSLAVLSHDGLVLWAWTAGPFDPKSAADADARVTGLGVEAAFEPDGQAVLALDADGRLRRTPVVAPGRLGESEAVGELVATGGARPVELLALALADDASRAVGVGCFDACTREVLAVWDAATRRSAATGVVMRDRDDRGDRGWPGFRLAMDLGPGFALAAGTSTFARAWDTAGWRPLPAPAGGSEALALSPDGGRVAVGGCRDGEFYLCSGGEVRVHDLAARAPRHTLTGPAAPVIGLVFTADGRQLLGVGRDGSAVLWDMSSGQAVSRADLPVRPREVALHAGEDGDLTAVVIPDAEPGILVLDARTGAPRHTLVDGPATPYALAVDRGGGRAAAGGCAKRRSFASIEEEFAARLRGEDTSACIRGVARVWRLADGAPVGGPLAGHAQEVVALEFSGDGAQLLTVDVGGAARLWDLAAGTSRDLGSDAGLIRAAAFSPDDAVLATLACGRGGCERGESELVLRYAVNLRPITAPRWAHAPTEAGLSRSRRFVRFADAGRLITASSDGVVDWDLDVQRLLRHVCRLAGRNLDADEWRQHIELRLTTGWRAFDEESAYHRLCDEYPLP
jgi:WD40 repeat protein